MSLSEDMPGATLEIVDVSRRFGPVVAVDRVSLTLAAGEIVAILGPSGSGKSTLLGMVGGQLRPDSGDIRISNHSIVDLAPNKRETATVFQDYALFPHLTVAENIAFGLRMHGWNKDAMERQVAYMLELLGLTGYERRAISQLSGGQRQRVATARSLAVQPRVLLLDEPLGALDRQIRVRLQKELAQLLRRLKMTALLVTHDQQEAFAMADRVAVMHQGQLLQIATPGELYRSPRSEFVATFLGKGQLLNARVVSAQPEHLTVEAAGAVFRCRGQAVPGSAVKVLIRPEHVLLKVNDSGDAVWRDLTVEEVTPAGETTDIVLTRGDLRIESVVLGPASQRLGEKAAVGLSPDGPVVMPQD